MDHWEQVWKFETARFVVALSVMPENHDPEDDFDDKRDVAFAREGGWHWFQARMQVIWRDSENPKRWAVERQLVLGEDHLGGCSYHDMEDFRRGAYFRDMVAEAISEAREKLGRVCATDAAIVPTRGTGR